MLVVEDRVKKRALLTADPTLQRRLLKKLEKHHCRPYQG